MPTSPHSGRRPASARRQLLAVLTAAFLLFQQAIIFAPASSAQVRRATTNDQMTPVKAPVASGVRTAPAPGVTVGPKIDQGSGSVSLNTLGSPVSQTFNALATSGTTNTTLPTGWYISESGGGTRDNDQYGADNGGSATGDIYSYGSAGPPVSTERALGQLRSGTLVPVIGAKFTNNTGSTITTLEISYTGEQWRIGNTAAARDDRMDFQISTNATNLCGPDSGTCTGTYTDVNALDFTNPVKTATTAGALDGNNAANRTGLTAQILNLNIPNGASFFVRWTDLDASGADDGLAVDDFIITPQPAVVAPSLTVSDVSQDEGNAGTTAFNFTVSLNDTLHDGVTFDICTADGTAQDDTPNTEDNDYVAKCLTGQSIPGGSNSYVFTVNVNGDATTEPNETFFVNVTNVSGAIVADGQGQGTIVNDDVTITPINVIQGSTPTAQGNANSPKLGETVTTTGIVTLLRTGTNNGGAANSFFIQTPQGADDGNADTSEGLLVFTNSAPTVAVGDSVRVTGTVAEFFNMTEISPTTSVSVLSTGNPLPAPVTLTTTILDPAAPPAQPQLEKYEGMRMTAASLVTVAPNDTFYEVETVLGGVQRPLREPGVEISTPSVPPDPNEATPDCCIPRWDENPERIKVDTNGRAGSPLNGYTSKVTFTNVTGPLDFSFSEYKVIPEQTPTASSNMVAVPAPAPAPDEFTVASYNIENFNNNATQRQKAALAIRDQLHLPDVIGTIEIFDLADLQALAAEIGTISGESYTAYLVEQDGTSEDNDQDVGFLVKNSRVQVNSVTQEREEETYAVPNGGGTATLHDRPPLVLDATVDPSGTSPQHVIVVVNHLRSFICIDADADPAVASGCDNGAADGPRVREKRRKQAESLAGLLQELQANNPGVPVMSVGDYNSYQFSDGFTDPIKTIKGLATVDNELAVDASPDLVNPDFVNVIDLLPAAERYSFVFEGTPQGLDHHIINAAARSRYTRAAVARVNADFPEAPAATYASNAARSERNSDHDPVVSYYRLGAAQTAGSLVISEFRFRGPGAPEAAPVAGGDEGGTNIPTSQDSDEFIEFYNNTDSDITVSTLDNSPGWALVAADGVTRFIIPNGTIIPARQHFLATGPGYSLNDYAQGDNVILPGDTGTPVNFYSQEIPDGSGIALFGTSDPANYTVANRLDAAGYATVDPLYREGAGFPAAGAEATSDLEYSFVRRVCVFAEAGCGAGLPKDTSENASDFIVVNTEGAETTLGAKLGAPGPEGLTSPVNGNAGMSGSLLDPSVSSSQEPNRVRDHTSNPSQQSPMGTLSIRRTITNNTGAPVVYLAFRIIEMTTLPTPAGTADLRAIDSGDVVATVNGEPVDVRGTYVEQPPFQPNGGGVNTSLGVGYIDLDGNALEDGDSVSVQFLLGVVHPGTFRFYVNIELINDAPVPEGAPAAPLLAPTSSKMRKFIQEQRVRQRARRNIK